MLRQGHGLDTFQSALLVRLTVAVRMRGYKKNCIKIHSDIP